MVAHSGYGILNHFLPFFSTQQYPNRRVISIVHYERSGLSKNKEALSFLVQQQATLLQPKDVINTPVTLEFLGLNERALVTETDLEQSILDNLQHFLLELLCKPLHNNSYANKFIMQSDLN